MQLNEITALLKKYRVGHSDAEWNMKTSFQYENDYLRIVRIDSSNKWISATELEKQWNVIFERKKDFTSLPTFTALSKEIKIAVTPVATGKNKGCFGIRVYGMKKAPDDVAVQNLLDYIFD